MAIIEIGDKELEGIVKSLEDNVAIVDSECQLSERCERLLNTDPKFCVNQELNILKQEIKVEVTMMQMRYDQWSKARIREQVNIIKQHRMFYTVKKLLTGKYSHTPLKK